jgi:GTPase SAR1 family protein
MAYLETSAALNINVDKIFEMLSGKIYQLYKQRSIKKISNRISVLSAIH